MAQATAAENHAPVFILRISEVRAKTGLSVSTIYSLIAAGAFPRPVQLSARCVGWPQSAIEDWLKSRIAASTEAPKPVMRRRRATVTAR